MSGDVDPPGAKLSDTFPSDPAERAIEVFLPADAETAERVQMMAEVS